MEYLHHRYAQFNTTVADERSGEELAFHYFEALGSQPGYIEAMLGDELVRLTIAQANALQLELASWIVYDNAREEQDALRAQ